MTKNLQNLILLIISLFTCLLLFEIGIRFAIKPADQCYGTLFGRELPPFKVKIGKKFHANYDEWVNKLVVNGEKITKGDLWSMLEEEPFIGYIPKKNSRSKNGWWQSNNLGARSRYDMEKKLLPGKQRLIIFGESFTSCSRVKQEETWPFFLNNKSENVEFVNFGVDGYGMGQSFLRYEMLRSQIDYNAVIFVFVPNEDLWRDVNVLRQLNGWQHYPLLPRLIIRGNQLELVKSPYNSYDDLERENSGYCSVRLKNYLRAYDRFYFIPKYESPPIIGRLVFYKLLARWYYSFQYRTLLSDIKKIDFEEAKILIKMFDKIEFQEKRDGVKFVLVILPYQNDLENYRNDVKFRRQYDELVSVFKQRGVICIDLMSDFLKLQPGQFDTGYDGSHYGPNLNRFIAESLWKRLRELSVI